MAHPMIYALRINDHSGDHADLILNGVRPAWMAMNAALGHHDLALRSHWSGGPHLALALARTPAVDARAWSLLEAGLKSWCDGPVTDPPLDAVAYHRLSTRLARAEQVNLIDAELRPDRTIEHGVQPVPDFLDDPKLSAIRDQFKAALVSDLFDLIEARVASPMGGLVELAVRLLFLERLRWRGASAMWPISINAQVHATRIVLPDADRAFDAVARRIEPALLERTHQNGALDRTAVLAPQDQLWVSRLQELHDTISNYMETLDPSYFRAFEDRSRRRYPDMGDNLRLNPEELGRLLRSPAYLGYRAMMNMLYDLFPTVGYSATHRIFACRLAVYTIRTLRPDILTSTGGVAATLVAP